jgi:hypothetical protein
MKLFDTNCCHAIVLLIVVDGYRKVVVIGCWYHGLKKFVYGTEAPSISCSAGCGVDENSTSAKQFLSSMYQEYQN